MNYQRKRVLCPGCHFHEEIVQYIMTIIPQEEVIVEATRKSVVSFPEIAIRELLANAMIHQDLCSKRYKSDGRSV